ncbi:hypothetical protein KAM469_23810 [Aeromonas caviae]|nr:hypothetical protein KAM468_24390 [Aeromonas caviae]GKR27922.1 hypothetical protein KAM469_23810 [Aeromonas caviae]GKR32331.1 hypothetical protein KAM470_24040 [Aeromonas caviae]GKR66217.1 hypothetical protein KAM478_24740 [Aeromonas caviae]GKR83034.1 hypothetical protein KAM482_22450 [Aeromonas caviae]
MSSGMQRRDFLRLGAGLLAAAALPFPSRADGVAESRIGKAWRLERALVTEFWPNRVGLGLADALDAALDWEIPATSQLVIRLTDGAHRLGRPISIRHPHAQRIAIRGNASMPELCRLLWDGPEDAIFAGAGIHLGEIDGVSIEHANPATRGAGSALLAEHGGSIRCGKAVLLRNFYYGAQARFGGSIHCRGVHCFNAGDAGFFAFSGGHLDAVNAVSIGANDAPRKLGSGFVAEYGGTINAEGATARQNALAGFAALSNGAIRAYRSITERNGHAGYMARSGGVIVAHDGSTLRNCGSGIVVHDTNSAVEANRLVNMNNHAAPHSCVTSPPPAV